MRNGFSLVVIAAVIVAMVPSGANGGPINSDVAFTPREGGSILRLQWGYAELDAGRQVNGIRAIQARAAFIYGLRSNLALILSAPYVRREVDRPLPRGRNVERTFEGVGDLTVLAKYRFWQRDYAPLHTARWAALGGLSLRAGDSDLTSDSYDPLLGTVYTWRHDRHLVDADLIYRLGTGRESFRHDTVRYDLVWSYRLLPAAYASDSFFALDFVAELNGSYVTDGSHEVFLAPGLQ
ncbi:MAG: transporter, partial [Phycisphaerae bacterium]